MSRVTPSAGAPSRVRVLKTLKMYVGGQFIRSESGQTIATTSSKGDPVHVCKASRKDLRDTMEIARAAQAGWGARTAYNRGQILYRLAEILEDRAAGLPSGSEDVLAAADRAVHHAGWCDKVTAVLSSLNPVGTAYVNYSMIRPLGVVVVCPRREDGLVGLVEAACAPVVMGNSVIVLVPTELSELAVAFGEALATSDVPGGVINLLTGDVPSVLEWADKLDDLDGLWLPDGSVSDALRTRSQEAAARVLRRIILSGPATSPADPLLMQKMAEVKTVWMSS